MQDCFTPKDYSITLSHNNYHSFRRRCQRQWDAKFSAGQSLSETIEEIYRTNCCAMDLVGYEKDRVTISLLGNYTQSVLVISVSGCK